MCILCIHITRSHLNSPAVINCTSPPAVIFFSGLSAASFSESSEGEPSPLKPNCNLVPAPQATPGMPGGPRKATVWAVEAKATASTSVDLTMVSCDETERRVSTIVLRHCCATATAEKMRLCLLQLTSSTANRSRQDEDSCTFHKPQTPQPNPTLSLNQSSRTADRGIGCCCLLLIT